jgi:hypothetical protein
MGETFSSFDEFVDAADEVIDGMCYHNQIEVLVYMSLHNPELFQEALRNVSNGCYDVS